MSIQVFTVGKIADILEQPPTRINYIIARDRIKANARVANIRLFDEIALERIRSALTSARSLKNRN